MDGHLREELSASVKRVAANRDIRGRFACRESSLPPNDRLSSLSAGVHYVVRSSRENTQITFTGRPQRRLLTLFRVHS